MLVDSRTEFADATSVGTPNNTTVNVGSQIDSSVARDLGTGNQAYLVIQVTTAIGSGGAATVSFILASDDSASIAVDGNQTIHWESEVFALASLTAGFELVIPLPPEGSNAYEQFLGFQVRENAGQALNAGAVNAFLTINAGGNKSYPDAVN